MTTETPVPETTPTPEQQQAQEQEAQTAFDTGFNETRGEEPPIQEPATKEEAPPAEATKEPEPNPEEPPATLIAGMTEEQVKGLFAKVPGLETRINDEIRKVYGKFGEIQGNLHKLTQQGQSTRKIEAGALKRVTAEYGPEFAQALSEDLSEVFGTASEPEKPASATETQPAADIDARVKASVDAAVAQVRETTEKKLLTVLHKDWETVSKEPEFRTFLSQLPGDHVPVLMKDGTYANYPKEAARYIESDDAMVAAEAFTQFKTWKAKTQKSSVRKQERLEQAVTPTRGGAAPPSTIDDEAAFAVGFNAVRAGAS